MAIEKLGVFAICVYLMRFLIFKISIWNLFQWFYNEIFNILSTENDKIGSLSRSHDFLQVASLANIFFFFL